MVKTYESFIELISSILPSEKVNAWKEEWLRYPDHFDGDSQYLDVRIQDFVKALAVMPIEDMEESTNP